MKYNWALMILLVLTLNVPGRADAQAKTTNTTISGLVVDADSASALADAHVILLDAGKNVINRTATDGQGHFTFANVGRGSYYLRVIMLGYKVMISKMITITDVSHPYNFKLNIGKSEEDDPAAIRDYYEYIDLLQDQEELIQEK